MIEFTLWDIVRNLLLAARWTILLSLVAFVGGGSVGLADPVRCGSRDAAGSRALRQRLHRACSRARRC